MAQSNGLTPDPEVSAADYRARIRWVHMCTALLLFQDAFRIARDTAAIELRKHRRW